MRIGKDLVAAAATPMVLGILAEGESYGYAILARVSELSGGDLEWSDGMLYPLLHRLERQGHIVSSWGAAPNGRPRKHYRLQPSGADALAEARAQWAVVHRALERAWHGRDGGAELAIGGLA
ncbi:PadR family transcriptional regulator [Agromyces seonyuensis]|uniref:PadR family transcriptional regulator n=1 Tax=Agromyces seonyuensis TaxID=2662446 RepID=A0A6I4P698_9MICO|nr:PadR family transcriptional regulator [Agromyces seonyuensis]MWC00080.1 PadR family transcriptional regulator [Agromyces seonyuensis]